MRAGLEIGTLLLVWGTPGPQSLFFLRLVLAPAEVSARCGWSQWYGPRVGRIGIRPSI